MMHVDKNANGHVVDQNVDRISREIAYLPLVGGSGLKVVHACNLFFLSLFFFFFLEKKLVQYMRTSGHDKRRISVMIMNLYMLSRGPMDMKFGRAF